MFRSIRAKRIRDVEAAAPLPGRKPGLRQRHYQTGHPDPKEPCLRKRQRKRRESQRSCPEFAAECEEHSRRQAQRIPESQREKSEARPDARIPDQLASGCEKSES